MHIDKPILIALILLVAILLGVFLVFPAYQRFLALRTELAEKKAEYVAQYEYFSEIDKNFTLLDARKEDVQKINDALPTDKDLGRLVYYFQKTAIANGLIIKNLFLSKSTASQTTKNKVNDEVFSLDLLGDYASLESFLAAIEKSARLFEVTSISFGSGTETSKSKQFDSSKLNSFNLEVKTHSY